MKKEIEDEWRRDSERRASRIKDPKKADLYRERIERIITTINLKEPDRVPVIPFIDCPGYWPAHIGITTEEFLFNYEKGSYAVKKALEDLQFDAHYVHSGSFPSGAGFGKLLESLELSEGIYWSGIPGRKGIPADEGILRGSTTVEWIKEDEYDRLLKDPYGYAFDTLLPRIVGLFRKEGLDFFASLIKVVGNALPWVYNMFSLSNEIVQMGIPLGPGELAVSIPTLDVINMLRSTKGYATDMYRHPEEFNKLQDGLLSLLIPAGALSKPFFGTPLVNIGFLHAESSMISPKQREKFSLPYTKKMLRGFIDENLIPMLFMEKGEPEYLVDYRELPEASCVLDLGMEDIFRAEEIIGDRQTIMGGVSTSLLVYGTPTKVEKRVKELCERCMEGGGFIISCEDPVERDTKPENLKAMVDATKKYGVYRR